MKRILAMLGMVLLCSLSAVAQNRQITGIVVDAENKGVVAASIEVQGKPYGSITDVEGRFKMSVPEGKVTLNISSIGYVTKSVVVQENDTKISVVLAENAQELKDVVVTSFGVKKQKKALGYAVGELKGEELTKNKEINLGNALQGKIAGVNVSAPVSGPSGSSRVVIRGATSASGLNQPLYVVDGIPIDNSQQGNAGMWGGADKGDGMSSFNPDDIASMSVLKGSAASALYGYRGSNGVILITTKKGKSGTGLGVDFSTNSTFNTPVSLLNWQDQYGAGAPVNGVAQRFTNLQELRDSYYFAWGDRYDGTPSLALDGSTKPYQAYGKDNVKNFYRTGYSFSNTLAISGGNETTNFRLSFGNTKDESIMPGTNFGRNNVSLSLNSAPNKKISIETNAQYISEKSHNRPYLNDSPRNASFPTTFLTPGTDIRWLSNGFDANGGEADYFGANTYQTNPYFATQSPLNDDLRKRFIGSAKVNYNITERIYAKAVIGIDDINYEYTEIEPTGINYNPGGSYENRVEGRTEVNASGFLGYKGDIAKNLSLDAFVGANRQHNRYSGIKMKGNNFIVPFKYFYGNTQPDKTEKLFSESEVNSLFYSADLGYKDYLYLSLTGRQDWFSTLDPSNNSTFYPSVSTSFIYSEVIELPEWMSYGKIRAGWGNVGGALPDAYALALTYTAPDGQTDSLGQPILGVNGETVPNRTLKPYNVSTIEFGFENTFFRNRVSTDLTFYRKKTTNDITDADISLASGYRTTKINVGEILNQGVEFAINVKAVKTPSFNWSIGYNFAYNDSEVIGLSDKITTKTLEGNRDSRASVVLEKGQPFGIIKAYDYLRDSKGQIVLDTNGRFMRGDLINAGRGVAPMAMGFSNDFSYKNFTLSVFVDAKFGGSIYSATNQLGTRYGLSEDTVTGREGGIAVSGHDVNGNPVNTTVSAYDYWRSYSDVTSNFVYDADFIKLRAVSFSYNFPKSYLSKTPFQSISLAFSAHNLWTIYDKVPNIDPESNYSNSNAQGLERASMPLTRNYGLTLNVKF
ncbi:SusC/RagA family TonB-linked outer membrane protein [Flavobacterium hibernum]|uniref:SusC/RagA family TonB-linked outer membrane protein n=1 Tax=Flavobacterium hibernum TaxID=37752 RepID=A0A0D0EVG0_9FLAO|nr:SusC/RagA family TonB-linked outer membrane protein [Flavobacterium hibernum]KIO52888.1 TonB-dependent receptor [Flavobacterium hibernum]OXA88529.1 SusC/RagA family TonB-linked outer membrane protein [Flavobacterium hibernum]STO15338.1 Outer membrane receptor for ferrienterochelin and colicins [Flavobacterium hibernum]